MSSSGPAMTEKTVAEMAEVIVSNPEVTDEITIARCPENTPQHETCPEPYIYMDGTDGCVDCWLNYATPAEIRRKYAELEGGE